MKKESTKGEKEERPEKLSFVEISVRSEALFTLLDSQYSLTPEERKALWKLFLLFSQHRNLLLSQKK